MPKGARPETILERARAQVSEATGTGSGEIVFTSGATEAAALALAGRGLRGAGVEHECVAAWVEAGLPVDAAGRAAVSDVAGSVLQAANSETGVLQDPPHGLAMIDAAQAVGKAPFAFEWSGAETAIVSAHKIGGPKGVGALLTRSGVDVEALIKGGGQELGRRAGTENLIGIAGFGAAAEAAARALADGVWEPVAELRDFMEAALEESANQTIFVGKGGPRLPNTSCFAVAGWKGETQVMQMDLDGFAVSAGSACSSGKVRESRALRAMGYGPEVASSAIRVSIGPTTTRDDVLAFVGAWLRQYERRSRRNAA